MCKANLKKKKRKCSWIRITWFAVLKVKMKYNSITGNDSMPKLEVGTVCILWFIYVALCMSFMLFAQDKFGLSVEMKMGLTDRWKDSLQKDSQVKYDQGHDQMNLVLWIWTTCNKLNLVDLNCFSL